MRVAGGRCQGDAAGSAWADACRLDGKADRALIERSLPYRQRLGASAAPPDPGPARLSAWLDSLGPLLGGCRGALGARELASLDIRSAAMPPARPSLLWSYINEPSYWWIDLENAGDLDEPRKQAKRAIDALYEAEQARLRGLPPRPWVRAQQALLALLAMQDAEVSFSVAHHKGFSMAPVGLVPAALAARLPRRLQGAGPLLRLREALRPGQDRVPQRAAERGLGADAGRTFRR